MTAEQIVAGIRRKDNQALAYLYDHYSGALMGIIFRILDNQEVAEEVLQQTMLKVWKKIDSFDASKASLFTWMATIARNTAIDKRRLKSFQRQEKTKPLDKSVYQVPTKTTNTSTAPIDVAKLAKLLEPNQKQVLDYVYLKGYTHKETAELLNMPLGTVKSRLRLALKTLRQELSNERSLLWGGLTLLTILLLLLL